MAWELLGGRIYSIVFWPGVLIHELSHAVGALITFTPIHRISLLPRDQGSLRIFGSVEFEGTKNPIKLIVISVTPLVVGAVLLSFGIRYFGAHPPLPAANVFSYGRYALALTHHITQTFSLKDPLNWLVLYLMITISIHLSPSRQDLKYTALGVLSIFLIVVATALLLPDSFARAAGFLAWGDQVSAMALMWLVPSTGVMLGMTTIVLVLFIGKIIARAAFAQK